VIEALDTNHDGIIEADEIANAAQSLKTLEKNGSNELTIEDLLGPPPRGMRPPPPPPGQGGPDDQAPPPQSGTDGQTGAPQTPPPPQ
jgi:hypothetical protein